MGAFTTGELARRARVSVETVRYYERRGLMPKPACASSGYRQYTAADLNRLEFIRCAQGLGFTLREIAELLSLIGSSATTCQQMQQIGARKMNEIDAQITDLQQKKRRLQRLVDGRCSAVRVMDCRVLRKKKIMVHLFDRGSFL